MLDRLAFWLTPWEFSIPVLAVCLLAAGVYARGLMRSRREGGNVGGWRALSYFAGLALIYLVLQSYVDYLSQHMFWIHRAQHLVLHHLGPFLIVLGAPHLVLPRGLPRRLRRRVLGPLWRSLPVQTSYRSLQHPVVAVLLFVGLIYFWLIPAIHFDAMLSLERYQVMNWSMAIDGLLFWWLILDPRSRNRHGTLRYGVRIAMVTAVVPPQIAIGAHMVFTPTVLFSVYNVCGRAWPISPLVDQQIGGLITWVPASMMSVVAGLLILRMWMRSRSEEAPMLAPRPAGIPVRA